MRVPVAPPVKPVAITGWPSALSTRATLTPLPPGIVVCSTVRWRRPSRKFGTDNVLSIAELRVTVMIMRRRGRSPARRWSRTTRRTCLPTRTVPPIRATTSSSGSGLVNQDFAFCSRSAAGTLEAATSGTRPTTRPFWRISTAPNALPGDDRPGHVVGAPDDPCARRHRADRAGTIRRTVRPATSASSAPRR